MAVTRLIRNQLNLSGSVGSNPTVSAYKVRYTPGFLYFLNCCFFIVVICAKLRYNNVIMPGLEDFMSRQNLKMPKIHGSIRSVL